MSKIVGLKLVLILVVCCISFIEVDAGNSRSKHRKNRPGSSSNNRSGSNSQSRDKWFGKRFRNKSTRGKTSRTQPNIIFIMADDLGWNDVGFHNPLVKTPNINWLARNGIELTDHHSLPSCSPSRASLLTGRYASNIGMNQDIIRSNSRSCLPTTLKLLPEIMVENGYRTKMVGKWHLGYCDKSCLPTARGFHEFRGIVDGRASYTTWGANNVTTRFVNDEPNIDNLGTHLTLQHQSDVRDMILSHKGRKSPLFMYISPLAPHDPLEVTPSMFNRHSFLSESNPSEFSRRKYLGLVAALDDLVGVTIRSLKKANLYKDCIIILTSDNGGASVPFIVPDSESHGNNYPLRGTKFELFEGAHRVPTIFHTSKLSSRFQGTKGDFLMHITDWLPTLSQLANPSYRKLGGIDGISQISNLNMYGCRRRRFNKYRVRKENLVYLTDFTRLNSNCSNSDAAYRWKDWKLIYGKSTSFPLIQPNSTGLWVKPVENPNLPSIGGDTCTKTDNFGNKFVGCLFNLRADPSEQNDLYYSHPEIVRMMKEKIDKFKRLAAKPIVNPSLNISSAITTMLGGVTVPRLGYCDPSIDSPLFPNDPRCNL